MPEMSTVEQVRAQFGPTAQVEFYQGTNDLVLVRAGGKEFTARREGTDWTIPEP
jgi:hypothetical protein